MNITFLPVLILETVAWTRSISPDRWDTKEEFDHRDDAQEEWSFLTARTEADVDQHIAFVLPLWHTTFRKVKRKKERGEPKRLRIIRHIFIKIFFETLQRMLPWVLYHFFLDTDQLSILFT